MNTKAENTYWPTAQRFLRFALGTQLRNKFPTDVLCISPIRASAINILIYNDMRLHVSPEDTSDFIETSRGLRNPPFDGAWATRLINTTNLATAVPLGWA